MRQQVVITSTEKAIAVAGLPIAPTERQAHHIDLAARLGQRATATSSTQGGLCVAMQPPHSRHSSPRLQRQPRPLPPLDEACAVSPSHNLNLASSAAVLTNNSVGWANPCQVP